MKRASWHHFRPLLVYLVFALPVLCWDIHRRQAARTFIRLDANLEGKALEGPLHVEVDGKAVAFDQPVSVGSRHIKVWSRDTEVWSTNRFVWYGENPLGTIRLERSRGDLRVTVKPIPLHVSLTGRLTNVVSTAAEPMFKGLPVGNYRVELRFPHFTRTVTAPVARNTINVLDQVFPIGHLHLESEPTGARYELQSLGGERVQARGQTPADIGGLPPGEYHLVLAREEYRLTRTVTLSGGHTNSTRVEFAYGKIDIATQPAEAVVSVNHQAKGTTPLVLEGLAPGRYTIRATCEGFHPGEWLVEVKGNDLFKVSTNLLSVRYTEAMKQAKGHLFGFSKNYHLAITNLAEALAAKPGDAEAAKLTLDAQYLVHVHDGRTALSAAQLTNALHAVEAALTMRSEGTEAKALKADIQRAVRINEQRAATEARRKEEEARLVAKAKQRAPAQITRMAHGPEAKFNQLVEGLPKGNVVQRWKTAASVTEVEAAVQRAVRQLSNEWRSRVEPIREDGMVYVSLEGVGPDIAKNPRLGLVQLAWPDRGTDVRLVFWNVVEPKPPETTSSSNGQGTGMLEALADSFRQALAKQLGKPLQ